MQSTTQRLEYLRAELRAERISYGELAELQSLADQIEPGDVELLEAAGVPEFEDFTPEEDDAYITDVPIGYSVSFDGKARTVTTGMDDAVRIVARAMRDAQFWPNLWYVNDHGNATLVEITDADRGTYRFTETAYV